MRSVVVVGMAALVLVPWTIRNYAVHGRFVLVSTQVGFLVYCGLHPKDGRIFGQCYGGEVQRIKEELPEAESGAELLRRAVGKVRANPGMLPHNIALKLTYFLSPSDWEILPADQASGSAVVNATYAFMIPFAVWGFVVARRRGWAAVLPALVVFAVALSVVPTESAPRYRLPLEPLIALDAGLGLSGVWELAAPSRWVASLGVGLYP